MPETTQQVIDRLNREQWQPIRDEHQSVHRGLGMELSDEDHAVVHDQSRPMHERAARLMQHVVQGHDREDYGWGGDTGGSGLGIHWTTDANVAHHFAKVEASHRVKYDEDADPQHGHNADGFPRQRPETRVVLHAHFPEHEHIAHEEDDKDGAFGWHERNTVQHSMNGGGVDFEREVPIKRGQPVKVHAISWGLASHRGDDPAPHDSETHRYDFPETQHHTAARAQLADGIRMTSPDQYRKLRLGDFPGNRLFQVRDRLQHEAPHYYSELHDHVAEHGVQAPVLVRGDTVMDGHHRLSIADELGQHVPVGDYDNQDHYNVSYNHPEAEGWRRKRRDTDGGRTATRVAKRSKEPQGCAYCSQPATRSLLWAEGHGYIPACDRHQGKARHEIEVTNTDEVAAVHKIGARWLPHERIFGPTHGLDKRLFTGERLKPDVREYVLHTLNAFWSPRYGPNWASWARVYLAGSQASEWTSQSLVGNNDFDILIGVHYDRAREASPVLAQLSDVAMSDRFNAEFRAGLQPHTDPTTITIDGHPEGPFSNTWYVNADSWDIRDIKPYAAYEIVSDRWWVKPPHLPTWSIHDFPQGPGLLKECQSYATIIRAIFKEPEPYRSQRADALWHYLHGDRSRAFGPNGEGWWDAGNVIEKYLDQAGLWEPLAAAHFATVADPSLLCAPARWSNDPTHGTAAR